MGRHVRVKAGKGPVNLPQGNDSVTFQDLDEVTLSDAEWAQISVAARAEYLVDLGAVADPDVGSLDQTFATDVAVAAETAARTGADTTEATARAAADTAEATARAAAITAMPRGELGYAERQTTDTSTNTVFANIPSNLISGLSLTVVGAGRAVEVEVNGSVYHSTANTYVGFGIVRDGATVAYGGVSSPSTTVGRSVIVKRRGVLVAGQTYVYTVGKYVGAAGTGSFYGDGIGSPLYLSIVER